MGVVGLSIYEEKFPAGGRKGSCSNKIALKLHFPADGSVLRGLFFLMCWFWLVPPALWTPGLWEGSGPSIPQHALPAL